MQGGAAMKQVIIELVRQNRRLLIAAAALLLLNVVLLCVISYYLSPAVVSSQASWNSLRQRIAVTGRADVQTVYSRGLEDLKKLSERIPVKRQFPRVLGDILDAAASSGVATGAVSYRAQTVKEDDLLAYGITMNVMGGYAAVKSFLSDLQKLNEMVVVDGISLSNTDLFEENVSMDLKLTVYLQGREGA
jgi:type IV pilus assembly protein PilO